jgi:hypothetical protein
MDHIVYVDADVKELEKIILGARTMIIRGTVKMKMPYGGVSPGDTLYFVRDTGRDLIRAQATVKNVLNTDRLTRKAASELLRAYQDQLRLTKKEAKRWTGKRYLVLITVEDVTPVVPFVIDRSNYAGANGWLPIGDILKVKSSRSTLWLGQKRCV